MTRAAAGQTRPGFRGLDRKAMQFWHELAFEMNRDWFQANKQRYESLWVEPVTAILAGAAARMASVYRGVKLSAPTVLRINRDIRFSKDKSPYKTWIAGRLSLGQQKPREGVSALYVHFGLDEEFTGAGRYIFADDVLARWRRRLADKVKGAEVAKIAADLRVAGYQLIAHETLARVPRPFAADHPRADLLRMKGMVVEFPAIPRGLIHRPELIEWLVDHARAAAPMNKGLHRNLG
jgi:uncharacterized protein (TIGR02453 family)